MAGVPSDIWLLFQLQSTVSYWTVPIYTAY